MATFEYWRADNMWAAEGRPDGQLGKEEVVVGKGQKRVFATDWRYEKQRNDGTNYYGSHGRRIHNAGPEELIVRLTAYPVGTSLIALKVALKGQSQGMKLAAGKTVDIKADIIEVSCP